MLDNVRMAILSWDIEEAIDARSFVPASPVSKLCSADMLTGEHAINSGPLACKHGSPRLPVSLLIDPPG